jgi:hypothetical protein
MPRLYAACWTSVVSPKGSSCTDFPPSCDAALEHPRKYLLDRCAIFGAREAGLGNVVGCWAFVFEALVEEGGVYSEHVDWEGVG